MLQSFRFVVHFIPGKIEHIVQEPFEQAMMTPDLQRPALPRFRETHAMMLLVLHERRPLAGQLLQHAGNRGRPDLQMRRQSVARDPLGRGTAQF